MCMCVCLCHCMLCVCECPWRSRGCPIPWSSSYRWLLLGTDLGSPRRAASTLNHRFISPALAYIFKQLENRRIPFNDVNVIQSGFGVHTESYWSAPASGSLCLSGCFPTGPEQRCPRDTVASKALPLGPLHRKCAASNMKGLEGKETFTSHQACGVGVSSHPLSFWVLGKVESVWERSMHTVHSKDHSEQLRWMSWLDSHREWRAACVSHSMMYQESKFCSNTKMKILPVGRDRAPHPCLLCVLPVLHACTLGFCQSGCKSLASAEPSWRAKLEASWFQCGMFAARRRKI